MNPTSDNQELNVVPMEEGKEGRSWILQQRLFTVITTEFRGMTVAEVTGVLFALATQLNIPR